MEDAAAASDDDDNDNNNNNLDNDDDIVPFMHVMLLSNCFIGKLKVETKALSYLVC